MNSNSVMNRADTDYLSYSYGLAIICGGLMGYIKAKSVPSLVSGLVFGAAATYGAYQVSSNPQNVYVTLIASGILLGFMGSKFYKSGKFMPAGLIAGLSLLQLGRMGYRLAN